MMVNLNWLPWANSPKAALELRMLVRKFLCNVNDTRALIGLLKSPSDITLRPYSRPLV